MKRQPLKTTQYYFLLTSGEQSEQLPIIIRKHPTSRRMVVRYQPLSHALSLTLPRYVSIRQGLHFIEEKRRWIERRISEHPSTIPLAPGQIIPVLGRNLTVEHRPGRGVTHIDGNHLVVHGEQSFIARRLREFLKRALKEEITRLANEKAKQVGVKIKKISLRDTSSRWGSCSHDGNLSFSWRLVFASPHILDYIVCHEVAHMREHNHSNKFWALVEALYPDWQKCDRWLSDEGAQLYRYN